MFKKIMTAIDNYFSSNEKQQIKNLKIEITDLQTEIKAKDLTIAQVIENKLSLMQEIDELKAQTIIINKHSSLENFKKYLDTSVPSNPKKYNFRGKGEEYCHLSLTDYSPEIMRTFIEDVMKFDYTTYRTADTMVYNFVLAFHKKYPNNIYYGSDMQNFGVADYWESPNEAVTRFSDKKSADCDAHGSAIYGCLRYLVETRFPEEKWRLRVFVVGPITGGGHYILSWVKEGPNDWIPLETTWYKDTIKKAWVNNLSLRSQIMYDVWWSFDEITEYAKL